MFLSIHLNLPIESANKNTQNSEMNSACFCLHFSPLKNGRKNDIINSERINLHGGLAMPYDKKTRDALQAYYETHDFTGNIPAFDDKKIYARTTSDLWQGEKVFCTVMAEAPSRNG